MSTSITSSFYFFFSSRRRHTRLTCDWSSDVCSSDLNSLEEIRLAGGPSTGALPPCRISSREFPPGGLRRKESRSEERRVGKEWRSRWSPYHQKKKSDNANLHSDCDHVYIIQTSQDVR